MTGESADDTSACVSVGEGKRHNVVFKSVLAKLSVKVAGSPRLNYMSLPRPDWIFSACVSFTGTVLALHNCFLATPRGTIILLHVLSWPSLWGYR